MRGTEVTDSDSVIVNLALRIVSEFYQQGCQEKSSASTGGEMFSRDPAQVIFPGEV